MDSVQGQGNRDHTLESQTPLPHRLWQGAYRLGLPHPDGTPPPGLARAPSPPLASGAAGALGLAPRLTTRPVRHERHAHSCAAPQPHFDDEASARASPLAQGRPAGAAASVSGEVGAGSSWPVSAHNPASAGAGWSDNKPPVLSYSVEAGARNGQEAGATSSSTGAPARAREVQQQTAPHVPQAQTRQVQRLGESPHIP